MIRRIGLSAVLLVAAVATCFAQRIPPPIGFVNDFANIISATDEAEITRIAEEVQRATGAEIAVATVESLGGYGSIDDLSIAMATQWGIGQRGKDNGVLLLVSLAERRTKIEVGYGLEGALPDGVVGRILDTSMVPYFRNDDFGTGLKKAVEGIAGLIADEYDVKLADVPLAESEKYARSAEGSTPNLIPFIVILILLIGGGGRFFWPLIFLGGMRRGGFGRGGFGVSTRGGFGGGGGFRGFGGGSFGGGGASRGF